MINELEDALHQGDEKAKRMRELGCLSCVYRDRASKTCDSVIEMSDTFYDCPYYKKEG